MKKNILTLINAVILCVGLAACGNGIKQYPFKAVAENIVEFVESVVNKPDLKNDETFNKDFRDKQESLLKKMVGTAIATTIDEGLGFELIGEKGDIINTKEGGWAREKVEILINFDLKIKDSQTALNNNALMVVFYDDKDNAVYVEHLQTPPSKNSDIINRRVRVYFKVFSAKPFVSITKAIIKKYNSELYRAINQSYEEKTEEERLRIKNAIGSSD